jgi:hypothetical protein
MFSANDSNVVEAMRGILWGLKDTDTLGILVKDALDVLSLPK